VKAVDANASVRDRLRAAGVDAKLGGVNRFRSIADAVTDDDGDDEDPIVRRSSPTVPTAAHEGVAS
jgi:hypothetical protein